ncbi:hypothetical protein [Candidatus Parabeggiatoa sp. HSG14]|uniref:hypothetical protein n=1 Tax=Candidatus Parabeggiatoa sp. HSG14 TaxID=3055593 RepID=UPI0025A70412|nr:hypothetical protein [Thiotrichales bacterium HSG14]
MTMIAIEKINETTFKVKVEGVKPTVHRVTITPAYYEKITGGRVSHEELIEKSFEFLLERKPNTSITSSFALRSINRDFSEYKSTIKEIFNL